MKVKFYSIIVSNGDGSASVLLYADKKTAEKAEKIEEDSGEAFTDNEPVHHILKFDDTGKLLNPDELPEPY